MSFVALAVESMMLVLMISDTIDRCCLHILTLDQVAVDASVMFPRVALTVRGDSACAQVQV